MSANKRLKDLERAIMPEDDGWPVIFQVMRHNHLTGERKKGNRYVMHKGTLTEKIDPEVKETTYYYHGREITQAEFLDRWPDYNPSVKIQFRDRSKDNDD